MKRMLLILIMASATISFASSTYDESVSGDLSDNYLSPTPLDFSPGSNVVTGTMLGGAEDFDLFTFDVPAGQVLTELRVLAFSGGMNGSFLGMQFGTVLSSPPSPTFADPIGYLLISSLMVDDGGNYLPQLVVGKPFNSQIPLPAGSYVVWLNETTFASSYSVEFVVVPEPRTYVLMALGLAFLYPVARRRVGGQE